MKQEDKIGECNTLHSSYDDYKTPLAMLFLSLHEPENPAAHVCRIPPCSS